MQDKRINFIFWIYAIKNRRIGYRDAIKLSQHYSLRELENIYKRIKV